MGPDAISRTPDAQPLAPDEAPRPSEWGGAQDDWGSGFDAPLQTSSGATAAFQFADLDAALDKVSASVAPKVPAASTTQQQPVSAPAGGQASEQPFPAGTSCTAAAGPELPAFYLHAAPEPARAVDQRLQPEHAAHVAELLRRYKEEEGQVRGSVPARSLNDPVSLEGISEVPLLSASREPAAKPCSHLVRYPTRTDRCRAGARRGIGAGR